MNASTHRDAAPAIHAGPDQAQSNDESVIELQPAFDAVEWEETRAELEDAGAGGRLVLGTALLALALLWIGYSAWGAGRSLSTEALLSPAVALWIAVSAGPLALLGLIWIMFGRTRRREAEHFTRSVIAMRTEVRSLEESLGSVTKRINDGHFAFERMTRDLVHLGEDAATRLAGITRELDGGSQALAQHSKALDRAAESARNDIAVLLSDLPRAEERARVMGEALQGASSNAMSQAESLAGRIAELMSRARDAETTINHSAQRLGARLAEVSQASGSATESLEHMTRASAQDLDALLARSAEALAQIRSGIDAQSGAVTALIDQASAAIGRAGTDSAEALAARLNEASESLDAVTAKLAEQDRISQRLFAGVDAAIAGLDGRFVALANDGDARTSALTGSLGRLRTELDALVERAGSGDEAIGSLAERAATLRSGVEQISTELREGLGGALDHAEGGAQRLLAAAEAARPQVEWMRDAAADAAARLDETGTDIRTQHDRLSALLAGLDEGVTESRAKLAELSESVRAAEADAARLQAESGPALIAALIQVRDAAAQATLRAREAIAQVIPEGAEQLSSQTRDALERAIRDSITAQLASVDQVAARAIEAARGATDRLSRQLISIGQTASALENHIAQTQEEQRHADSEAFGRRVSMLIDSMNSASIDVGKVLADEIDDRSWQAYLKGDRGVFTRRAARLMGNSEARAIQNHYETDREFQQSVNRYVHDFEAMLRRVLNERDGGMIAVTLLSSDMGKLYAALGQAVERKR